MQRPEQDAEQDDGPGLVGGGERDRHHEQQGGDAKRDLGERHQRHQMQRLPRLGRQGLPARRRPDQKHGQEQPDRQPAMDELRRGRAFERVQPGRLGGQELARQQPAVHQRERVVEEAAVEPGHEAAEADGEAGEDEESDQMPAQTRGNGRVVRFGTRPQQAEGEPEHVAVNDERQAEMEDEAILADRDLLAEAARHHEPAEEALQPAEQEQGGKMRRHPLGDAAADQEPEEGQGEDDADQPAEQTMGPFPPEDRLELGQAHAGIEGAVLRDRAVEVEDPLPLGLGERRQGAHERRPFHDREAGFGQAGDAADDYDGEDHQAAAEQPQGDGAVGTPVGRGAGAAQALVGGEDHARDVARGHPQGKAL